MKPKGTGKRSRGRGILVRVLFFLLALSLLPLALAHPANVSSAQAKVQPDGTYTMRIRFDLSAFLTNRTPREADDATMSAIVDGPDDALKTSLSDAERRFRAGFGTTPSGTIDRLEFPSVADVRGFLAGNPVPRLPIMLTATVIGHLPTGSRTIAFRYPGIFDTIIQTVEFPYKEPISEPVEPGATSSTLTIPTAEEVARLRAAMDAPRVIPQPSVPKSVAPKMSAPKPVEIPKPKSASVKALAKTEKAAPVAVSAPSTEPRPSLPAPKAKPIPHIPSGAAAPKPATVAAPPKTEAVSSKVEPSPAGAQVLTYLRMGYRHILPEGLDHILFVLGLFLLGSNTKALLKQITAFTVAHSITLALATLDIVRLPGRVIEPLIALSIAFVAIENLFIKDVRRWRTAVVFLFGLVHGMGFAEVFKDAGLSGRGLVTALLSFNVGVELGQLSVVAMALLAFGWFRKDPRYRSAVVVPASLLIAMVALFWTAQRILA